MSVVVIYLWVSCKMKDRKKVVERTLFIGAVLTRNKLSKVESLRLRYCGFDAFDEVVLFHKAVVDAGKRDFGKFVKEVQQS